MNMLGLVIPFGLKSVIFYFSTIVGLKMLWQAATGNIARDSFGDPRFGPRWLYALGGILLQIPLIAYMIFVNHQAALIREVTR